jgi:hypothetical protein
MLRPALFVPLVLLVAIATPLCAADRPGPVQSAVALDKQLASEVNLATKAKWCDDETYLRRVSLDILGRHPSIEEITAYALDPAPSKRIKVVERMLDNKAYGENWAGYWRDVIMYRRTEERALLASQALNDYLVKELNNNTPWDKLASSFITAEGDVRENGATALFMAQQGRPEETTAEVARIFLGIQIQCAQCHDHPTDRWKREQFHQMAAFFPRVSVRPNRDQKMRSFEVVGQDTFRGAGRMNNNNRFRGSAEHRMPDLEDPTAAGKLIEPVFFATGQSLKSGAKDTVRRESLATWLTAPSNEWFAKAIVNRMWSELVGEGFYEPVDDMGPDRECSAPKTLELLSQQFVASGHDVKWLMTTIMATDAYQRQSTKRRDPNEQPFTANVAQRLRADQVFNNLVAVLGVPDNRAGGGRGAYGFGRSPRNAFSLVFGYDPSSPRDEVSGSIPQALAMMNSPVVNGAINARGRTELATLLSEIKDDRALIIELYLKTIARQPTESEITTCLAHVKEVNNRAEAFEDLQWALVNSTEFLHRR